MSQMLLPTILLLCAAPAFEAARIGVEAELDEVNNVIPQEAHDYLENEDFDDTVVSKWQPEFPRYVRDEDVNWDAPYSHLNTYSSLLDVNGTAKPYEGAKCCYRTDSKGQEQARWFYWRENGKYQGVWHCPSKWTGAWFDSTCKPGTRSYNKYGYQEDSDIVICYKRVGKRQKYKYYTYGGSYRPCVDRVTDLKRLCKNRYGNSYQCYEKTSSQTCQNYQTVEHIDVDADKISCSKGYSKAVNPGSRFCRSPGYSDKLKEMFDYLSWSACAGFPKRCENLFCTKHSDEDSGNTANGGCWRNCPSVSGA